MTRTVYTVASGDLRLSANQTCWPTQARLEADFAAAVEALGWSVTRGHPFDEAAGHGFIDSQRAGIEIFKGIPPDVPLVVVEAVWQYSHHVLPGLRTHRGPILLVANWSGEFPGLVGLLNLGASLTKAGVPHSVLWSEDFTDDWARAGLRTWLETGAVTHDTSHVRDHQDAPGPEADLGRSLAAELQREKAIIGVFDEGCMGMYNAIIDDEQLNPLGIYKERLSQSALVAEMGRVGDDEAQAVRTWLDDAGMTFHTGSDEATELTDAQILSQCRMYVAALRIADDFGLDAVGIQYQQGLKDTVPASDLVEGLLNDGRRPPVRSRDGSRELYPGVPLPHFNEVDEGAAVDALVTNRVWTAMGLDPATTLHDVRWGADYDGQFVWVFEISGSVPASHNGGYDKSWSMRSSGRASSSWTARCTWTSAAPPRSRCRRRRPGGAWRPRRRSGRSCTRSSTGSRATSSWRATRRTTSTSRTRRTTRRRTARCTRRPRCSRRSVCTCTSAATCTDL
jgi:hypothetical protein